MKYLFRRYDKSRARSVKSSSGFKLLAVTLKLLKEKSQLLILPITMFIGAEQAFLFADYNAVSEPHIYIYIAIYIHILALWKEKAH